MISPFLEVILLSIFARLQLFGCCKKVREFLVIGCFVFEQNSHSLLSTLKWRSKVSKQEDTMPGVSSNVKLGEICVFIKNGKWKIGS